VIDVTGFTCQLCGKWLPNSGSYTRHRGSKKCLERQKQTLTEENLQDQTQIENYPELDPDEYDPMEEQVLSEGEEELQQNEIASDEEFEEEVSEPAELENEEEDNERTNPFDENRPFFDLEKDMNLDESKTLPSCFLRSCLHSLLM